MFDPEHLPPLAAEEQVSDCCCWEYAVGLPAVVDLAVTESLTVVPQHQVELGQPVLTDHQVIVPLDPDFPVWPALEENQVSPQHEETELQLHC